MTTKLFDKNIAAADFIAEIKAQYSSCTEETQPHYVIGALSAQLNMLANAYPEVAASLQSAADFMKRVPVC